MKYYIIFNPLSKSGALAEKAKLFGQEENLNAEYFDITKINSFEAFFAEITDNNDKIVLLGGDGTLNRFINSTQDIKIENEILYYASGTGNDFLRDLGIKVVTTLSFNQYIKNLPIVYINKKAYKFINGIGSGIDGYCCAEVERKKQQSKNVSYALVALKGLLFAYKPFNCTVNIDGSKQTYEKVWMALTMKGKFFGGGIKIAPNQDRNDPEDKVTCQVVHGLNTLKIIRLFPSIFKGTHIKHTKYVTLNRGHNISVKFDRPITLQIDGEVFDNITEYEVKTNAYLEKEKAALV